MTTAKVLRMALFVLVGLVGCAGSNSGGSDEEDDADDGSSFALGPRQSMPTVTFKPTAEGNYLAGEKAFQDEDYLAAQRYFGRIRAKFPYSRYATLANLRIADCQYAREVFLQAIDSYQNFVRLHPNHEKVGYARFRVGLCYYKQIPSDFFIMPPSHERDQAAVSDAEKALLGFVKAHPDDENATEAKEILADVRSRLMDHERYVADFYKNLERDRAYVGRLEIIRTKFADVGLTDELLLEIAEVWARLGEVDRVRSAIDEMKAKFPESEALEDAQELLASLPAKKAEDPSPKDTDAPSDGASDKPSAE